MKTEIKILDHGYVRLITYTPHDMVGLGEAIRAGDLDRARLLIEGHDLSEVNAARASYGKQKDTLDEKDTRLIAFLAESHPQHTSPFRHNHLTLEINAPLPVARQWWRHAIGVGTTEDGTPWSELSRRYVRGGIQYHRPETWRSKPENSKQGSGADLSPEDQIRADSAFTAVCDKAVGVYEFLVNDLNVAPEQARFVLPQGVYTSWRWSPSVQALTNFFIHRLKADTQYETRLFAQAVYELTKPIFPLAIEALAE